MKKKINTAVSWFLKLEGIDHFIASTIAVIGLSAQHVHAFWAWFLPILDYLAGIGTLFSGWWIGRKDKDKEDNKDA